MEFRMRGMEIRLRVKRRFALQVTLAQLLHILYFLIRLILDENSALSCAAIGFERLSRMWKSMIRRSDLMLFAGCILDYYSIQDGSLASA
ncbi:hypothetical protein QQ045_008177 [Rhodiola kirilowii]